MSVHFPAPSLCRVCGRATDDAGVCLCVTLPALDAPPPGSYCERCGAPLVIVDYCGACEEGEAMAYRLERGGVIDGVDGDEVRVARAAYDWDGGDAGPHPDDALARAIHAVDVFRAEKAYRDRESQRWHEAAARQLRVEADLREARQRAAVRAAVRGEGRHALDTRHS